MSIKDDVLQEISEDFSVLSEEFDANTKMILEKKAVKEEEEEEEKDDEEKEEVEEEEEKDDEEKEEVEEEEEKDDEDKEEVEEEEDKEESDDDEEEDKEKVEESNMSDAATEIDELADDGKKEAEIVKIIAKNYKVPTATATKWVKATLK